MKLPRLPNKCSVLEAKYSTQQMREYGEKCIKEYINNALLKIEDELKNIPTLTEVVPPPKQSFIDSIRDALR